jgi:alkanesulfonate monooxygenase SsuD/methylene tetrahydromethanopterin reductase-like flavin-dependent oxidoreductase (luciferase family)
LGLNFRLADGRAATVGPGDRNLLPMRFGVVILPELPWARSAERWSRAEELGFEHAWSYDHLTWRSFRDLPWFATIPTLTAAALATSRLRVGTLVASPNFRHPLPFAKELISLDDISGGRVIAGIGAGGQGWDATALGQAAWAPSERRARFVEFVTLTDLLLRQPELTWRGHYYSVEEARTYPGCVQQPRLPLAIAASGPTGLRLAARHGDLWVTTGSSVAGQLGPDDGPKMVGAQVRALESACRDIGRDPSTLRKLVLSGLALDPGLSSVAAFRETVMRYEDVGVTDFVVHWPRSSQPFAGDIARFEEIFSA